MSVYVQFNKVGRSNASWQAKLSAWNEVCLAKEAKKKLASKAVDIFFRDGEPGIADIMVGWGRLVGTVQLLITDEGKAIQKAKDYKEVFRK